MSMRYVDMIGRPIAKAKPFVPTRFVDLLKSDPRYLSGGEVVKPHDHPVGYVVDEEHFNSDQHRPAEPAHGEHPSRTFSDFALHSHAHRHFQKDALAKVDETFEVECPECGRTNSIGTDESLPRGVAECAYSESGGCHAQFRVSDINRGTGPFQKP